MLKLGYKASAEQFGPRELLDFSVVAEEVGFDSVMVSDHFQPWRHHGGHAPYSLAWLAALGERTSRVTIGTSVATPTFRYHPSIVAQAIGTIAVLNPGRVILGVGTGESMNEVPATGMEWPKFKERPRRQSQRFIGEVTLLRVAQIGEPIPLAKPQEDLPQSHVGSKLTKSLFFIIFLFLAFQRQFFEKREILTNLSYHFEA